MKFMGMPQESNCRLIFSSHPMIPPMPSAGDVKKKGTYLFEP